MGLNALCRRCSSRSACASTQSDLTTILSTAQSDLDLHCPFMACEQFYDVECDGVKDRTNGTELWEGVGMGERQIELETDREIGIQRIEKESLCILEQ